MPKILTEKCLQPLINAVSLYSYGASAKDLRETLSDSSPLRTFQSHISKLVKAGRLISVGKGRAVRYYLASGCMLLKEEEAEYTVARELLTLSPVGLGCKERVTACISTRAPVGYNRAFLDDYRPNQTFYLSLDIGRELLRLGTVSGTTQSADTHLRKIHNRLLVDLSWNSSRLEGNSYSFLETERLIEVGEITERENAEDASMILNHKDAIKFLCEEAPELAFNSYTICNMHAILSENLISDSHSWGRLRKKPVEVKGTVFHPLDVPQMIEECFGIILEKASAIIDPFEQSFFAMVHLLYLQPFENANKGVSMLASNIPLVKKNLCPLSFIDVTRSDYASAIVNVYELNNIEYLRDVFVRAYRRSCTRYSMVRQTVGAPDPFRTQHRGYIKSTVRTVVTQCMSENDAVAFIRSSLPETLLPDDYSRLQEVVETELSSLFEGSIARYRLHPSEFHAWQRNWK